MESAFQSCAAFRPSRFSEVDPSRQTSIQFCCERNSNPWTAHCEKKKSQIGRPKSCPRFRSSAASNEHNFPCKAFNLRERRDRKEVQEMLSWRALRSLRSVLVTLA